MITYQELLDDTVEYYSHNPRSRNDKTCVYIGPVSRCAVGRCCKDTPEVNEFLITFDKGLSAGDYGSGVARVFASARLKNIQVLQDEYTHLNDVTFWEGLQKLHYGLSGWKEDSPDACERTLSPYGLLSYKSISNYINTFLVTQPEPSNDQ